MLPFWLECITWTLIENLVRAGSSNAFVSLIYSYNNLSYFILHCPSYLLPSLLEFFSAWPLTHLYTFCVTYWVVLFCFSLFLILVIIRNSFSTLFSPSKIFVISILTLFQICGLFFIIKISFVWVNMTNMFSDVPCLIPFH